MASEDPTVTSLIAYNKACRQYLPNKHCDLLTSGYINDTMHHHPFSRVMGLGEIVLIKLWHGAVSYLPNNKMYLGNDVFSSMKGIILSDEVLYKNKKKLIQTLGHLPPIIGLSNIWEKEKRINSFYSSIPPIIDKQFVQRMGALLLYTSNDNDIIHHCLLVLRELLSIHKANVFIKCKMHTILIHLISKWTKTLLPFTNDNLNHDAYHNIIDGLQILSIWSNYQTLVQLKQHNFISTLDNWVNQWYLQLPVSILYIQIWELVAVILNNIMAKLLYYDYDDYEVVMDIVYNILESVFKLIPNSFEKQTKEVKINCCKVITNLVDIHKFDGIIDCLNQEFHELYVAKHLIQEISSEHPALRCEVIKMFNGIIYEYPEEELQILIEEGQILNKIKSVLNANILSDTQQHWIFILLSNIICHDYFAQIITNDCELIEIITNALSSSNFTDIRDGSIYCINNLLNTADEMTQCILFKQLIPSFCTSLKKLNQYTMNEGNKREYIALIKNITNKLQKYNKSGRNEQLNVLQLVANQLKEYQFMSIFDDLMFNDNNNIFIKDILWIILGNLQYLTDIASHDTIKKMNEWNNKMLIVNKEAEDNLWIILGKTPTQKM